jgi:hypothetical protein
MAALVVTLGATSWAPAGVGGRQGVRAAAPGRRQQRAQAGGQGLCRALGSAATHPERPAGTGAGAGPAGPLVAPYPSSCSDDLLRGGAVGQRCGGRVGARRGGGRACCAAKDAVRGTTGAAGAARGAATVQAVRVGSSQRLARATGGGVVAACPLRAGVCAPRRAAPQRGLRAACARRARSGAPGAGFCLAQSREQRARGAARRMRPQDARSCSPTPQPSPAVGRARTRQCGDSCAAVLQLTRRRARSCEILRRVRGGWAVRSSGSGRAARNSGRDAIRGCGKSGAGRGIIQQRCAV